MASQEILDFVDAYIEACTLKRRELETESARVFKAESPELRNLSSRLQDMSNDIETYSKKVLLGYLDTGKIVIE